MKVDRFPKNDHTNGWYNTLDYHTPARVLEGSQTADWVVVGGGFAGLAAARRLGELRPSDRVVLLEAGRVGENASGRNAGFIIDLPHSLSNDKPEHDYRQIRINRQAIAWLSSIVEGHQIRCFWSKRGKVHVAATRAGSRSLDVMQKRLESIGEPVERWDPETLRSYLGIECFHDGVYTPGCILMQPAALVTGLARSMPPNVDVFENSAVVSRTRGQVHELETAKGRVTAPQIVFATNGWTDAFGFLKRKLTTLHTFGSLTRPLTVKEQGQLGGVGDWGTIPSLLGGTTMRYTQDRRLLIRRSLRHRPDGTITSRDMRQVRRDHIDTLRTRFPMLEDVTFEHTWGGIMCFSRNHVPKCGSLGEDGIWAAVCQNGVGAARGTISGRAVAEMATGTDTDLVADMSAWDELQRFPPRIVTVPAMRARLLYSTMTAGPEA